MQELSVSLLITLFAIILNECMVEFTVTRKSMAVLERGTRRACELLEQCSLMVPI